MKKKLIATTLTLLLAIGAGAAPQAQSPTPQDSQEIEATAQPDAIEVFSDTTSTTTAAAAVPANSDDADESDDDAEELFEKMVRHTFTFTDTTFAGLFFLLAFLFILFSPIGILALLFYFIYKNRKQRLKFAEQAMKNGQTIPDGFVNAQPTAPSDDLRTKGIRQLFLGIGLMVLLYNVAGNIGLGIGALVACIGLGNLVVSRSDNNRKNQDNNINQEQNIQYYD